MFMLFEWCSQDRVLRVFGLIKTILNVIRIIVPIGLVVMTSLDVMKHVINPSDKDGGKKIMHRVIAAVIVFFIPVFVRFTLKIVDIGLGNDSRTSNSISACWR